jgi:hypothetical protein
MATRKRNVNKATAVGVAAGGVFAPVIAYGAGVVELKTGVPAIVTMPIFGAVAGLFMRWAAKLNPND